MGDKSASARLKLARAILEDEVTLVESFLTLRHVPLQLLLRRLSYSMQIFLEPLLVYQNKFGGTIEYEAFLESVNRIVEPHKIILSKLRNRIRVRKTLVASGVSNPTVVEFLGRSPNHWRYLSREFPFSRSVSRFCRFGWKRSKRCCPRPTE